MPLPPDHEGSSNPAVRFLARLETDGLLPAEDSDIWSQAVRAPSDHRLMNLNQIGVSAGGVHRHLLLLEAKRNAPMIDAPKCREQHGAQQADGASIGEAQALGHLGEGPHGRGADPTAEASFRLAPLRRPALL